MRYKCSLSSHPYQYLLSLVFLINHSTKCEVISHCGFDWHFPDVWWCWTSFHVLIGHLYVVCPLKSERQRIDAFELWCWRKLLRVPWTARRSNQFILKEISPGCSLEGLMLKLKLQYFGHLMRKFDSLEKTDAERDWGQEEKGTTEDEMAGWHHRLDGHEFE